MKNRTVYYFFVKGVPPPEDLFLDVSEHANMKRKTELKLSSTRYSGYGSASLAKNA